MAAGHAWGGERLDACLLVQKSSAIGKCCPPNTIGGARFVCTGAFFDPLPECVLAGAGVKGLA